MSIQPKTALIILAAGSSSRLGRPKQQLEFRGTTLLENAIQAGLQAGCSSLTVVLGAFHQDIKPLVASKGVKTVVHLDWQLGMGSTIKAGMEALLADEAPDQVMLMLCDQPYVDAHLLRQLFAMKIQTGKVMAACSYGDSVGVPALFDRSAFHLLRDMDDQAGAKKILLKHADEVALVPFALGNIDIDTEEDYQKLLQRNS